MFYTCDLGNSICCFNANLQYQNIRFVISHKNALQFRLAIKVYLIKYAKINFSFLSVGSSFLQISEKKSLIPKIFISYIF